MILRPALWILSVVFRAAIPLFGIIPDGVIAEEIWTVESIPEKSIEQLETRLDYINKQLNELADFQIVSGMGPIGFRSNQISTNSPNEWLEIQLDSPQVIDQIVIVPTLWRSTRNGPQADAFPISFKVIVLSDSGEQTTVAEYDSDDQLIPRIAPLVIHIEPQEATGVRIEVDVLGKRAWDQVDCLQLSEVILFSGQQNVALHQTVASSSSEDLDSRNRKHLVDGILPYFMGLRNGEQSTAYLIKYNKALSPVLTIDLGEIYSISQVNLHAVESSDTIPQTVPSNYALPKSFIVEGAIQADFSDVRTLYEYHIRSVFDAGPIQMERFPTTPCRYVRLRVREPYLNAFNQSNEAILGFSEIEVFSNGINVATEKEVSSNILPKDFGRTLEALTDGHNFFGRIIPIRDWLEQLSLRHEMERERPLLMERLQQHYERQKDVLNQMSWLVAILTIIAIFLSILTRLIAQRSKQRLRERIAADLHDELGANLHAIGLLSDLSQKAQDNPSKLNNLLERIRRLTERTGAAARHCTNMLEAEELYSDVTDQMQRASKRLLHDIQHDLSTVGIEHLVKLSPRRRIDLCLFYQECLTNILRHSEATKVTTRLQADARQLELQITDNGKGLDDSQSSRIPKSISRRSRLLGAKVDVHSPVEGGTSIHLVLRLRSFRFN